MTESVDILVVGAGPAGLRAAQVLAEAGREVLVVERNAEVGPKTCAGGLTTKTVRELAALGMPPDAGVVRRVHGSFRGEGPFAIEAAKAMVRTLSRRRLGAMQLAWARGAGAEVRTATPASGVDLAGRTLTAGGRRLRWRRLVGADGSTSIVRKALGLPTPRAYFAAEFNVRGLAAGRLAAEPMVIRFDAAALGNGYFWVFPHEDYASVGAGVHKAVVPPAAVRPYLERRAAELGIPLGDTPYEGATIEVALVGFDFPGGVHLVGDAAGCPSALTAEGIYPALVTGEEVARRILEPGHPSPKTEAWLRSKRLHDPIGRFWTRRAAREASFRALAAMWRRDPVRRWMARSVFGE